MRNCAMVVRLRAMTSVYEAGRVLPILMHHRLRIAREDTGLDQGELAAAIGVSRNTIVNAESGRRRPHPPVLMAWAIACGVRLSWLLTGVGTPPSNETADRQTGKPVGWLVRGHLPQPASMLFTVITQADCLASPHDLSAN